ncbi:hypothetical protein DBV05_g10909 [Lasiodiplodia theobromae]|uniref:Heterokaryon incompatibility domain-containing protein n=1 Tax=Lasiodiplodia theobromae TaxID=45133 RepID=A0A5N5CYI2_9PEZI|nr:hypothetical protein DBV05_g10909 [Lasiodiplodia theobromae]
MGETYRKAADTLVLSADLMRIDITDLPIIDSLHYISLSAWVSRLWTLQEGCLSRTLHIRFKSSSLRYDPFLRELLEHQYTCALGWVNYFDLTDIENRIRGGEDRSWQLNGEYAPGKLFSVTDVAFALARRSTSVIQDEALCLGSLLGADMGSIAKASREDRMKTLLMHLPSIPQGLLFWNGPKMEDPGFRWAPRSFMGINNPDYIATFDDRDAKITPRGLIIKAPGLILDNLPSQLKHDIHLYLIIEDRNGKMYHMVKHDWLPDRDGEEPNVFTVATPDYTHIALLCEANISDPERFDLFTESIMVFIYEVADGVTYARRGDSGMLSCQSAHAEDSLVSYIKRDPNLDAQEDVPKLEHAKEYLVHLGGRNMYAASYGTWDKEERLWCID